MHVPSIAVSLVLRVQSGREERVWKEQWWNVEERQSGWQGLGERVKMACCTWKVYCSGGAWGCLRYHSQASKIAQCGKVLPG